MTDNKYFVVEYTVKSRWGVLIEASSFKEAETKFENGDWDSPWEIGVDGEIDGVDTIFESNEEGDEL